MRESVKKTISFLNDRDKLIFALLTRTIKELRCHKYVRKVYVSTEGIITCCMNSRSTHSGETLYENISFWPQDLGLGLKRHFCCLFYARIISHVMLNEKNFRVWSNSRKIIEKFNNELYNVVSNACIDEHKEFLIKYGKELGEAILACQDIYKKMGINIIISVTWPFFRFIKGKELGCNSFEV